LKGFSVAATNTHKRATIHHVAQEAGVSYQTVSRVINGNPHVARDTRARVMRAIHKLDYQPFQAARNLSLRRSNTLQIIAFNWNHYSLQSIVLTAKQHGYEVNVSYIQRHDTTELNDTLDRLAARLIDGAIIIAMPFEYPSRDMHKKARGIPLVQLGGFPNQFVPYIGYDQSLAAKIALDHLLSLGHTKIAELCGSSNYPAGLVRHQSIADELEKHGLEVERCIETDWTPKGGYANTLKLLESGQRFTAIICSNDLIAQGAISALHQAGKRVPEDISVISFDDIPEAAYFVPALTTVRQDFDGIGVQSVEFLLSLIKNRDTPVQQRILYPELIVRESTAPCSKR
jgi:DNA-binding LacI/PurR family transcriptional regulator